MLNLPGINDAQYYTGSTVSTESLNRADAQMRNLLRVGGQLFDMAINAAQINEAVATGQATRASVEGLYGNILGDNGRVIRTSVEGVSDMASDAWEALKNWIKEMIRKVQDFFLKYSVFIKRTKESLKKLKSQLKSRVGREANKMKYVINGDSFKDKWDGEKIMSIKALNEITGTSGLFAADKIDELFSRADARPSSNVTNGYDSGELKLKLDDKIDEALDKLTDPEQGDYGTSLIGTSGVMVNANNIQLHVDAYYKFADWIIKAKEQVVKDYDKAYKAADKFKGRFMGMKASSLQNARQTLHQSLLALFKISSAFRKSASKLNKCIASALRIHSDTIAANSRDTNNADLVEA